MTVDLQGLIACSRYSFAPNSLHYCGPERQNDMLGYVSLANADQELAEILNRFETLYPYLVLIASENHIKDPFDRRVVEAYWLGNSLLTRVKAKALAAHLADGLDFKRKLPAKKFFPMMHHVVDGGIPQHNFHVLNIFLRTGHLMVAHTLATMDNCRISFGKIIEVGNQYIVEVQPLVYKNKSLALGKPEKRMVTNIAVRPKIGEWVSIHWGYICDVLTQGQRNNLRRYTLLALQKANKNISTHESINRFM